MCTSTTISITSKLSKRPLSHSLSVSSCFLIWSALRCLTVHPSPPTRDLILMKSVTRTTGERKYVWDKIVALRSMQLPTTRSQTTRTRKQIYLRPECIQSPHPETRPHSPQHVHPLWTILLHPQPTPPRGTATHAPLPALQHLDRFPHLWSA
ncbi:hypothetical protein B0H16DRAFT_1516713, partial [Mycena metata]